MMALRLFFDKRLDLLLEGMIRSLENEIDNQEDDYILGVSADEYISHLVGKYSLGTLEVYYDHVYITEAETFVDASDFPPSFHVLPGKYKKPVIQYHIPYSGDQSLLTYNPNVIGGQYVADANVTNEEIVIDVVDMYEDPERANNEFEEAKRRFINTLSTLRQKIDNHNKALESVVRSMVLSRIDRASDRRDNMAKVPYPMKKRGDIPQAFQVPRKRRAITTKPVSNPTKHVDNYTILIDSDYQFILGVIEQVGEEMERHPSIYIDKDEESLRDLLLMTLSTHYESADGEVFNKSGKTDIFIQHKGKKIFAAECKIWHGESEFASAFSQLKGYLTWRDSKSALIIYVRNKDFGKVMQTIADAMRGLDGFIREIAAPGINRITSEMLLDPADDIKFLLTVIGVHVVDS